MTLGQKIGAFVRQNYALLLLLVLAALLLQDIFGTHGVLTMRESQKQARQIRAEIERLNKENQELLDRAKALRTDPGEIERIAREEMGLSRPGEYVFKLQPKASENSGTAAAPPNK